MLDDKDFEWHLRQTRRLAIVGMIVAVCTPICVVVFLGWVIVKLLTHFGVI